MTDDPKLHTRRSALATLAAAGLATPFVALAGESRPSDSSARSTPSPLMGDVRDWDFLVGKWNVRHRRLKARLVGNTEWEEFNGTCVNWSTMGGLGNVDDNVIELPAGTYRAVGLRAFDRGTRLWSIWWLDGRTPSRIDPPVRGGFANGIGSFVGDDTLNGRPIKVRFQWSQVKANSAHWEQAFSPDGGATWETNWLMEFTRSRS